MIPLHRYVFYQQDTGTLFTISVRKIDEVNPYLLCKIKLVESGLYISKNFTTPKLLRSEISSISYYFSKKGDRWKIQYYLFNHTLNYDTELKY